MDTLLLENWTIRAESMERKHKAGSYRVLCAQASVHEEPRCTVKYSILQKVVIIGRESVPLVSHEVA